MKNDKENPILYDMIRDEEVLFNFLEKNLPGKRTLYNRKMPESLKNS